MILLLVLGLSSLVASSNPPVDSTQGKWTVLKNDGSPCIKFYATVELQLNYVDQDDAVCINAQIDAPRFTVPPNSIAATGKGKSSCYEQVEVGDSFIDSQILHLDFPDNEGWNVRLAFTQDPRMGVNEGDYALWQVTVTANYSSMSDLFPNSAEGHKHTYSSVIDFNNPPLIADVEYTATGHSLYCPNSPQGFIINDDASVGPSAYIGLSDLWMQAYMDSDDFGARLFYTSLYESSGNVAYLFKECSQL